MNVRKALSPVVVFSVVATCVSVAGEAESAREGGLKVPFKLERKRVVIPTGVNGSRTFGLILDTGMPFDGAYLFHKEFANDIDMSEAIEVRVPGAGAGEASTALMIESGTLTFGEVAVDSQRVIIAQSFHTQGFPSDGVMGWNLFGHYAVKIDYDAEMITLFDTAGFAADSTWTAIPISLRNNTAFIEGVLEVVEGEKVPVSLYIDLASDEALELLLRPGQKFTAPEGQPESYLGTGLSGDIHGTRGEVKQLSVDGFALHEIPTAFAPANVRSKQEDADGVLGNDFIRRFNVIFDYAHELLYLKPNKTYRAAFD